MKAISTIAAGLIGTSCMTLFSYLISKSHKRNFKEPELLGKMTHRLVPAVNKKEAQSAGWVLHYLTGVGFAATYATLLKKTHTKPTLPLMLLVGGLSGVAAVAIWDTTFEKHPLPPVIHYKRYYGHLVATHIVFSCATLLMLRMAGDGKSKES